MQDKAFLRCRGRRLCALPDSCTDVPPVAFELAEQAVSCYTHAASPSILQTHMKLMSLRRLGALMFPLVLAFACIAPVAESAPAPRKSSMPVVVVSEAELDSLMAAAEGGNAAAQIRLGHYYMDHYEEGFANETKAGEWFRKAAESGNAEAEAWYAIYLFVTHPSPKEGEQIAREWARKSAEQENPIGLYLMGIMTPRTQPEGRQEWLLPAAKQGFVPAMRALAASMLNDHKHPMEDKSDPVVKDAFKWLAKAARSRDCAAFMVASGSEGRSESRGIGQKTLIHPLKESEKFAKAAIAAAVQRQWQWYDTIFDFEFPLRRYVAGGARYYQLIRAYLNLRTLYEFKHEDKKAAKIPGQVVAHLKKLAKEDPVAANYALAHLLGMWSFYMGQETPMPDEDSKEYARKAAEAEVLNYCDHQLRRSAAEM